MLSNPFRRKTRQPSGSSSKPGGIRIGLAQRGQQQQQQQYAKDQLEHSQLGVDSNAAASSSSSTFLSLPPESDYRTSLIMPHLTRRFTLLRAPDGSMVTPDAMRAQLRAQRARARATGQPGGNFLTEQEEDEIIDQMRQQTLSEQANDADGSRFTVGSGSDGFGANYASSVGGGSRSSAADRIGSLTESLGELKSISSGGGGSLFSGRSSERDNAYLRSLDKNKAASLASPIEEEEEEEEEEQEQEQEQDNVEAEPEDEHVSHDDVAMPGGFGGDSPRGAPTLTPPSYQQPQRQSQLLSALSPEAFRRVSTALEEVIGIVSPGSLPRLGGVPGEDAEADYEIDAISAEESDEGEARDIDDEEPRQSLATSNGDASLDQHAAARAHEAAGDEADDEVSEDDDVSQRHAFRRETPDSDGASFQSAKEEAGASTTAVHEDVQRTPTLDQTPRLEVMTTPRNAASTTPRAYSPAAMPTTPSSSASNAPVLSAGAIAARSQRYFPQAGAGVKTTLPIEYASGFRSGPTTPITPNDPNLAAAAPPSRRQPPPTSLDVQKSINASQEDVLSPTTGGLFPQPPTHDPVLAQRWQQTYGLAGAHDGSSIGGGSESEFERQFEQEPEVDDVWAKVARNLGEEEGENGDARPVSQMPPAEAASQFDGNTVDRLAQIQANLVRSVSQRNDQDQAGTVPSAAPPMPQLPLQSTTTSTPTPPSSDYQQPPISPAKVEKARERARMIAAERTRSGSVGRSTPSSPAGPARGGSSSEDSAWPTSPMGQLSQSNSQRSFKGREVMYDVTSSHRPTSPPPGRSSGGLPTIQDLSALNGAQPDTVHYHMSLSQAVDYAANYFDGERYSDGHSRPFATINDTQDYGGLFGDSIAEDDEGEGAGATTQSHPYSHLSPRSAQTTWSNPRSPRQDDFGSPQQHDFSPGSGCGAAGAGFNANLVDDVAAQAQAATVALKGPHSADGGPHLTPRRSRVLSKRKNKRNPGKFIGAPELLTTSQYMGHAQPIPEPAVTKKSSPTSSRGDANARRPPVRQASDYRNDPKTMPATLLHRRRSSSFGHSGRLEPTSPAGPRPGEWATVATPPSALPASHQRSPPASAPAAATLAAPGTPASTKSTASFGGTIPASSSNGSISRLMSKMRMRKPVEGATTPVQTSPNPSTGAGRATPLRGPSPFGIRSGGEGGQGHGNNGLSADSTLPESGAVRMAGMMPSPSVERGERHDSSQMGQWSGRSAPLANEDSWRASSNAGESTTEAPAAKEGGALLGSPAAIHEDSFGGFLPAWQQQQQQQQQQPSMASQDRTSTASGNPSDTAPVAAAAADPGADTNGRASARNTIIRRTLIFPSEAAANEEQRRRASVVSTAPSFASKRKSRRAQGDFDDDEANASYAALLAGKDESPRPSSQIRRSEDGGGGGASRAAMRASRVSRVGGASLRPPSFATSARRVSTATGGADGGSYAGSLYDMYIGPGAGDGDDSIYEGSRPASYAQGGPIGSHIEVTERADGSVVWQVIAGLGNKEGGERRGGGASADGGSAGKHTRGNSDASQFSFLNRPPRDSYADGNNGAPHDIAAGQHRGAGGDERTFTGLLRDGEDDSRSLFQRQRTESNVAAAMKQQRAKQREAADLPLPPWQAQAQAQQSASSPTSDGQGHADSPDATAAAAAAAVRAFNLRLADSTSETRVVYSNDVELEQLLESLARQHEDGGKFLFDPKQYYAVKRRLMEGSGGGEDHDGAAADEGTRRAVNAAAATAAMRPVSRFYREGEEGGGEIYDGQEQRSAITSPESGYSEGANGKTISATPSLLQQQSEAGRRRVEDEIMNLLGQQTVPAAAAAEGPASSGGRASG